MQMKINISKNITIVLIAVVVLIPGCGFKCADKKLIDANIKTLLITVSTLLPGFGFKCVDTILVEKYSPDRRLIAMVYRVGCGATTRDSVQINLRTATEAFAPEPQDSFFVAETEKSVDLNWTGQRTIKISVPKESKLFVQEKLAKGCIIEYEWK